MTYYRLYRLSGSSGRIVSFEEIEAEDDDAAEQAAQAYRDHRALELWCGPRKVASIEPLKDGAADGD